MGDDTKQPVHDKYINEIYYFLISPISPNNDDGMTCYVGYKEKEYDTESEAELAMEQEETIEEELDEEILWTKGMKQEYEQPLYQVTTLKERDEIPEGGQFITTKRQMDQWNKELNPNWDGTFTPLSEGFE